MSYVSPSPFLHMSSLSFEVVITSRTLFSILVIKVYSKLFTESLRVSLQVSMGKTNQYCYWTFSCPTVLSVISSTYYFSKFTYFRVQRRERKEEDRSYWKLRYNYLYGRDPKILFKKMYVSPSTYTNDGTLQRKRNNGVKSRRSLQLRVIRDT